MILFNIFNCKILDLTNNIEGSYNIDESKPYIGQVLVNILSVQNRKRDEYRAMLDKTHWSWVAFLGHVQEYGTTTRYNKDKNMPTHKRGIRVAPNYIGSDL
jgi:hypothetical protein